MTAAPTAELDPFDLPEWLGTAPVTWAADGGLTGHLVVGHLTGADGDELPCDLLAVDDAYPEPVVEHELRTRVHQVWRHGQVLLVRRDDRTCVATPGSSYDVEVVLEALTRVAMAVGADPAAWSVRLGLASH